MKLGFLLSLLSIPFFIGNVQGYMMQVTQTEYSIIPSTDPETLGSAYAKIYYRNNSTGNITSGYQVCQWIIYDPNDNRSNLPIGSTMTGPIYLPNTNSSGYVFYGLQDRRIQPNTHLKAYVYFWNIFPSDQGLWNPYTNGTIITLQ
ncbi:MAG: hypothetical protein NTX81_01830 [Candidatus Bathyarchaeota archaeon]|nr:hypothetical protein [Candidatus Bathyarchaeota archaeon]